MRSLEPIHVERSRTRISRSSAAPGAAFLHRAFLLLRHLQYSHERQPTLAQPEIHQAFRAYCHRAEARNVAVGRYGIMPEHVHLFVALPPTKATLPGWIQMLRTLLGKTLLRLGIQKPHWQEGFFDHLLRRAESYSEKWEYVRMNPVRAGLSRTPEEWPYQGEIVSIRF